jgi:DNA-binding beta-propeller fold protein YncE
MLLLPRNKRIALCLAMLISALAPQGRAHADAAGDWRIESPVGDGTPGTVGQPFGVELGPDGGLYICEVENHRIRRYDLETRALTTVAGTGRAGYSGDGGPALEADMNEPYEIRFDDAGNLFVVEMKNHIVRRINGKTGVITTVAGTGREGYGGDGGPATEALLKQPHSIALDGMCGLLIADIGNHRIRRVDLASGTIRTFAGNGEKTLPRDGQQAEGNPMVGPRALFVDGDTLWIALREGHSVWRMNLNTGTLAHVAGTGNKGFTGDGGPAREATFDGPKGIAVGPDGNVYVVDTENQAIRMIDTHSGVISTIAGSGPDARGFGGDSGPATAASMDRPHGIGIGPDGVVYIGDTNSHRVRRVWRSGE